MQFFPLVTVLLLVLGGLAGLSSDSENVETTMINSPETDQKIIPDMDISEKNQGFFIENMGQWDDDIQFLASTSFGHIGLGKDCVFFDVREITEIESKMNPELELFDTMMEELPPELEITGQVVKYTFEGARDIEPIGVDPLVQLNNYFIGNDPDKWVRGARTFQSVIYKDLYEEIDLKYYFNEQGPKYDLILNPGSDPEDIKIHVEGHESLSIINDGLMVHLPKGNSILDDGLISFYQDDRNFFIRSNFEFIDSDTFTFNLGDYDARRIVVIDPLIYCTYLGTSSNEIKTTFRIDPNDRPVLVAQVNSQDFPTTSGAYNETLTGASDLVVLMLSNDVSNIIFSTFIGGTDDDSVFDFHIDSSGNIIVLGFTISTDFPTTAGAFDRTHNGKYDQAFFKLNNDGTDLLISTYIGGSENDYFYSNFYKSEVGYILGGHTQSDNFPTTAGAFDDALEGFVDMVVLHLKDDGSDLIFSTYIGGDANEYADIMFDENGNIFLRGYTGSSNFPTTAGAYDRSHNGGLDLFILQLKNDGSDLVYSTYIGGSDSEQLIRCLFDNDGNITIAGWTDSTDFPTTPGAYNRTIVNRKIFLIKLKRDMSDILFSTAIGRPSNGLEGNMILRQDANGDYYLAGGTSDGGFPITSGAFDNLMNGPNDLYLLKMKKDGSELIFSTYIGGNYFESVSFFELDPFGNAIIIGITESTATFPVSMDAMDSSFNGGDDDLYLIQMSEDGSELIYGSYFGGDNNEDGTIRMDNSGAIYISGIAWSTDLPTTPGVINETHNGLQDFYIMKCTLSSNTEPTALYSLKAFSQPDFSDRVTMVDKEQTIYVEITGQDGNSSNQDFTTVDIEFRWSPLNLISLRLIETGENTGIYRGNFVIPVSIDYFEEITITSKKDPTKFDKLFVDSPYRPVSVSSLEIFSDPGFSYKNDKFDIEDSIYIKVIGEDASPSTTDFAFVNITKNENETFLLMERLEETGDNTGTYTGSITVPSTFMYFENITISSVRNNDASDSYMVHTPLQIRPFEDILWAKEDQEYRSGYWNFGYETAIWTMDTMASWLNWDDENQEVFGTPDNSHVGVWDVTISIDDDKMHSDVHQYQITVENTPPTILTEDVTQAREGDIYEVDYACDDDGKGNVTWSLISFNTWLTMDEATGELSGLPYHTDVGIHPVTVIVEDGNGGEDRSAFEIEVRAFNKPPEILSMDITTGTQGELYYRDYEAHDPNEHDILEWFLNTNAYFLSIENTTGILSGTPGAEDAGVFYVNVTVKDQDGLMDSHVFDLTIENVNDMPFWENVPENAEVYHGQHFIFNVIAMDHDIGDVLKYSIRSKPESDIDIDPDTGEIDWIASVQWFEEDPYELEITIEVSDGELFRSHKFTITVFPTESPTVQLVGPEPGVRTPSTNTVLEWEGSDPENEPITYDIYIHENQAYVDGKREEALHMEQYEGDSYTVTGLPFGRTYYWTIIPHDGCSFGTCDGGVRSFTLNNPPTIKDVPDQEISAGSEFKFRVSTSDDDDMDKGNLIHTLVNAPEGMRISEDTGTIRWTPSNEQVGWYTITVGVYDGIETTITTYGIEVIASEESEFPIMILAIIGGILALVIIALLVFLLIRKREPKEVKEPKEKSIDEEAEEIIREMEEHQKEQEWEKDHYRDTETNVVSEVPLTAAEAHAQDKTKHKASYEELYGQPAPDVEEEDVTTEELRDHIKETADKLEQMEPPEEEDNFLDDLISQAHTESEDIVHRGQEDVSDNE